jgi:threonyl-tRNA synthetase
VGFNEPLEHVTVAHDHRKLGKELDIFAFDDEIGKGLPLWLPNGTVIRDELEKLMRELEFEAGFQRIATPHVAKRELYEKSGHLPYFAEHMFPAMEVRPRRERAASAKTGRATALAAEREDGAQVLYLRPMNCPHHHKVFAARKRSYRELPLRLAEYGQTYRYEDSGAVSGLLRVRGMCMNDAHIYCSRGQILSECDAVLEMHRRVYAILGLEPASIRLSTRARGTEASHKFTDDFEAWRDAEALLRQVLVSSGLPFEEVAGEAAFYGPKIDSQFRFAGGREETASTLQLDFQSSARLDLTYVGADGALHRPFIIHRAPLGTHERFVALLLERYDGAFPLWLAPIQVRVLPVSARFAAYGGRVVSSLRRHGVRAEIDASGQSLGKRIGDAARQKIPHLLIVGSREQARETITVRRRGGLERPDVPVAAYESELLRSIATRRSD